MTSRRLSPWIFCTLAVIVGCDKGRSATEATPTASVTTDDKDQGGTGGRARGEEGVMGAEKSGYAHARPASAPLASAANSPVPYGTATAPLDSLNAGIGGAPAKMVDPGANAAFAQPLDPNARYMTTYRPGGAALAAFDAAVAKGSIPGSYKDLVGDFGGRYAPAMDKPATGAMAFQVDTERASLAPAGGMMNIRIAMRSSDQMPTRAQLSVHLVLDISGSMSGAAIDNAKNAAATLVQKLDGADDFSMVTFSNEATLLVPDGAIGPRKQAVLSKIQGVQADGGTNISAGLDLGYKEAHTTSINADAVKIVMLLSDGHANAGDTNPTTLANRALHAFQDGIQTSSFGLGPDYDAALMASFADQGAGGYYYLADSTQIAPALSHELDARLVPVAQAVEVRLRLRPDVTPTRVFGSRALDTEESAHVRQQEVAVDQQAAKHDGIKQDRQSDAEGGMRFFMPSFARDDRHAMLITVQVPAGTGDKSVASVEVRYKDRLQHKNVTQEIPVHVTYAADENASAQTINKSVAATVQAFSAGDTILRAARRVDLGDRAGAASALNERADILKKAQTDLNEPKLGEDALRIARLASAVQGNGAISDPLPLAVMLRGSGYGYLR